MSWQLWGSVSFLLLPEYQSRPPPLRDPQYASPPRLAYCCTRDPYRSIPGKTYNCMRKVLLPVGSSPRDRRTPNFANTSKLVGSLNGCLILHLAEDAWMHLLKSYHYRTEDLQCIILSINFKCLNYCGSPAPLSSLKEYSFYSYIKWISQQWETLSDEGWCRHLKTKYWAGKHKKKTITVVHDITAWTEIKLITATLKKQRMLGYLCCDIHQLTCHLATIPLPLLKSAKGEGDGKVPSKHSPLEVKGSSHIQ